MAEQRWRKFPVNTLYNTRIQFVVKRLPKELKHAAFTLLSSCYCNADDDGVVDMTDFEIYADGIFLEPEELRILIDKLCGAGILHRFAPDIDIYAIADWELPEYKNANKRETLNERRQRIAKWSDTPTPCYPPLQNDKNENFVTQDFIATKNENLLHSQEREIDRERKIERTEEEQNRPDEIDIETHRKSVDATSNLSADADCVTCNATTQEKDKKKQTRKNKSKQTSKKDSDKKDSVEGSGESLETTEKYTIPLNTKGLGEKEEKPDFIPAKHIDCYMILQERFVNEGIVKFPDEQKEIEALKTLAVRILPMCDDKNTPNTVANLFVSRFKALLKQGETTKGYEYFRSMQLLPSNLLKSACWERIFVSVQQILWPHRPANEWQNEMKLAKKRKEQDIASGMFDKWHKENCERLGISPDDPDSLAKILMAGGKK